MADPAISREKKSSNLSTVVILLLLALVAAGVYYYLESEGLLRSDLSPCALHLATRVTC